MVRERTKVMVVRLIDVDKLIKPTYAEDDNITGSGMSYAEMDGYNDAIDMMWNYISSAPTIDAVPVVYGRWIKNNDSFQTDDYYCCYFDYNCSECGGIANDRYKLPNYCPNCGAKMNGEG